MKHFSLLIFIALVFVISACKEQINDGDEIKYKWVKIGEFSGEEERQEIANITREWMSDVGYCCEGREMPFKIMSVTDNHFTGTRVQYDSMYAQANGTFKINGYFEWSTADGSWTGHFWGDLTIGTGVTVDYKGMGQGAYDGLYFEMHSIHPGDPTTPTGTGTFTGELFQKQRI